MVYDKSLQCVVGGKVMKCGDIQGVEFGYFVEREAQGNKNKDKDKDKNSQ